MKAPYSGEPEKDWQLAKGPFKFLGIPSQCVGELGLINTSSQKIKVRSLSTIGQSALKGAAEALGEVVVALRAKIPSKGSLKTQARLQIDTFTPPGVYETKVVCGKQQELVQVKVLENHDLRIQPRHIKLKGASGDTLSYTIQLANFGNMPVVLHDAAMIWLEEKNWVGRTFVYMMRDSVEGETHQQFLDRVVDGFRASMVAPVSVHFEPKADAVLPPGVSVERNMTLTLPKGLQKGKVYHGFIKINEKRVWVELNCNGSHNSTKRR